MGNKVQLIIDGALAEDKWAWCADEAAIGDVPAIISLTRLESEHEALRQKNVPLGVVLRNAGIGRTKAGEDVHRLAPHLDMLAVVAIEFDTYRNGRGFSAARILREQYNYKGEIRATGEVLYDLWQFMQRCGINAFEIDSTIDLARFKQGVNALPDAYQPAGDAWRGILWNRHSKG